MSILVMIGRFFRRFRTLGWRWTVSWAIQSSLREIQDGIHLLSYRHNEDFIDRTREALALIQANDPLNYRRVTRFLHMVTDLGFGGGYYDPRHHAYHVNQFDVRKEVIGRYAADIIHEAIHGRLERCRIPYQGNEARHENLCKQVQTRFLERIGEQKLASIVRSIGEWWSDEAAREVRVAFLEAMQNEYKSESGVPDRCLARFYGMMARKQKGNDTLKSLRQYKRNHLDVLEFDRDGDGKADQWEHYDDGVINLVELDCQGLGWANQRHLYVNGQLHRIEKLRQDGTIEYIGYVRYSKQGTRREIYWIAPAGHLTTVQLYIGKELVGKSILDDRGVVIETKGQARHHIGEKIVMDFENFG